MAAAWWEQRGAGLSYDRGIPSETMMPEQFIADTLSVTDYYLRDRFGKEKIYLMAHPGGMFTGLQTAARHRRPITRALAWAKVVHQLKSEKLAYEYLLEVAIDLSGPTVPCGQGDSVFGCSSGDEGVVNGAAREPSAASLA